MHFFLKTLVFSIWSFFIINFQNKQKETFSNNWVSLFDTDRYDITLLKCKFVLEESLKAKKKTPIFFPYNILYPFIEKTLKTMSL